MASLFDVLVADKAISVLNAVNDGMKEKDKFKLEPELWKRYKQYFIIVAESRVYGRMFNILTDTGDFPEGMPTNWRIWNNILDDLGF